MELNALFQHEKLFADPQERKNRNFQRTCWSQICMPRGLGKYQPLVSNHSLGKVKQQPTTTTHTS